MDCIFHFSPTKFYSQKLDSSVEGYLRKYRKLLATTYKNITFKQMITKKVLLSLLKKSLIVYVMYYYLLKWLDESLVLVIHMELGFCQQTLHHVHERSSTTLYFHDFAQVIPFLQSHYTFSQCYLFKTII